jgi:hypothetical protein
MPTEKSMLLNHFGFLSMSCCPERASATHQGGRHHGKFLVIPDEDEAIFFILNSYFH